MTTKIELKTPTTDKEKDDYKLLQQNCAKLDELEYKFIISQNAVTAEGKKMYD